MQSFASFFAAVILVAGVNSVLAQTAGDSAMAAVEFYSRMELNHTDSMLLRRYSDRLNKNPDERALQTGDRSAVVC